MFREIISWITRKKSILEKNWFAWLRDAKDDRLSWKARIAIWMLFISLALVAVWLLVDSIVCWLEKELSVLQGNQFLPSAITLAVFGLVAGISKFWIGTDGHKETGKGYPRSIRGFSGASCHFPKTISGAINK